MSGVASYLLQVCAVLLFIMPAALSQVPDDIRASLTGRGHALLIGVARYDGNSWPELGSIETDLQALQRELAPHFQTITPLPNPTTEQIRSTLRRFLGEQRSAEDARLMIYYAGHGFTAYNPSSQQTTGYITGRDTPRCEDATCDSARLNAIPFSEIDSLNRETRATHVLMMFDSCFSGAVFLTRSDAVDAARYTEDRARTALREPVRYYITAGAANERVPANSPFAPLILRGLRGEADLYNDGFVTAEALGAYLQRNLPVMARVAITPQKGPIADARLSTGQFLFLTGLNRAAVAPKPDAAEIFQTAKAAKDRGQDAEAARLYRLAADKGNALAQAALGWFYESGLGGLAKDDVQAARLYRLAVGEGDAWVPARLAWFYEKGQAGLAQDDIEAARLYRLAADKGNASAQDILGSFYQEGRGGLAQDDIQAIRLYRLAAAQGYADSQSRIGSFYEIGRAGLPKDEGTAIRWYQEAARNDNADAQKALKRLGQPW
jgi:TPR repeat protein